MRARLTAVLDQRVGRVLFVSQDLLVGVCEVEIVEGEGRCPDVVYFGKFLLEGFDLFVSSCQLRH